MNLIKYLTITGIISQQNISITDYLKLLTGCIITKVKNDRYIKTM